MDTQIRPREKGYCPGKLELPSFSAHAECSTCENLANWEGLRQGSHWAQIPPININARDCDLTANTHRVEVAA